MTLPIVPVLVLIATASILAAVLRAARIPGGRSSAAIGAGIIVGVLLGPLVLGKAAPSTHEHWFVGGTAERQLLSGLERDAGADIEALRAAGTPDAIDDRLTRLETDRAPLASAYDGARRNHAARLIAPIIGLVAAGAFLGARAVPHAPSPRRWTDNALPALMGVFFAALPAALLAIWLLGFDRRTALALGGASAAGSILAGLPIPHPCTRDDQPHAMTLITLMALIAGIVIAIAHPPALVWLAPLAGAFVLGRLAALVMPRSDQARAGARAVVYALVVPGTVASAAVHIHWDALASWKPALFALLALLFNGGGHLVGVWLGAHLGPTPWRPRATLVFLDAHASGVSATQAAAALALLASGVLDPARPADSAALGALLLAALLAEVLAPNTRRVASTLDEITPP